LPHRDGAKQAPIDLGTLARGKGQGEKGGLPSGSDGTDIGFDQGIATIRLVFTGRPTKLDEVVKTCFERG
jgi:hypothetical protein